jgi:hypothetical protein
MADKVITLHPDPSKSGVNISREKYGAIKNTIIDVLRERGIVTFKDLNIHVGEILEGKFDGSIGWYVTTVKLDLEARKVIERLPDPGLQKLKLKV